MKADGEKVRGGIDLNGCLWPKAAIRGPDLGGVINIIGVVSV